MKKPAHTDAERLDIVEARIDALSNLLLCHIVATEALQENTIRETISHAQVQVDAATRDGNDKGAFHLNRSIKELSLFLKKSTS